MLFIPKSMPSSYICLMNCTKVVISEQRIMVQPHKKTLECKNLHHYLKTLPSDVLDQLYNHPATCLAVFRYLSCNHGPHLMDVIFAESSTRCLSSL